MEPSKSQFNMGRSTRSRPRPNSGPWIPHGHGQTGRPPEAFPTWGFRSVSSRCTSKHGIDDLRASKISCGAAAINSIIGARVVDDRILARTHALLGEREYADKGASAWGLLAVLAAFRIGQQLHRRSVRHPQYPGLTDTLHPDADEHVLLNDGQVQMCAAVER